MKQLSILEAIVEGERLRDEGLQRAVDHAGKKWSDAVYSLFLDWLANKPFGYRFMTEDFRREIKGQISDPPSLRAFGFICPKAAREGLIVSAGTDKVKNSRAHRANGGVWKKIF